MVDRSEVGGKFDFEGFKRGIDGIIAGAKESGELMRNLATYLYEAVTQNSTISQEIRLEFVEHVALQLASCAKGLGILQDRAGRKDFAHRVVGMVLDRVLAKNSEAGGGPSGAERDGGGEVDKVRRSLRKRAGFRAGLGPDEGGWQG